MKRRILFTLASGLALASIAGTAFAANDASVTIDEGAAPTVSVAGTAGFGSVGYSHTQQSLDLATPLALTVDDQSGTAGGWSVSMVATDLTGNNANVVGSKIDKANIAVSTANIAGQNGASTTGVTGASSASFAGGAVTVLQAGAGSGVGAYTADIDLALTIPGHTVAGNYTGTLTTTIAVAPTAP